MKLNDNKKIIGTNVILIPYEAKHVEKYHEWMIDPEMQELTGSELLSLDEEYEQQQSWRIHNGKLTFLVLDKAKYDDNTSTNDDKKEIESLIGDTNIYIFDDTAEAAIMIAEKDAQGRRLGWEAMLIMLSYSCTNLNINKFIVKIGMSNQKSINMFVKMQFVETSRSDVFKEITFERNVDKEWINWMDSEIKFEIMDYQNIEKK